MRLQAAYARLALDPPAVHESQMARRLALAPDASMRGVRGLGTSVEMLVELYLDMARVRSQTAASRFVAVCLDAGHGSHLRLALTDIHRRLDLDVDLARVTFFPQWKDGSQFRGVRIPSWGVFCDHAVKEVEGYERPRAPYGMVRRVVERSGDRFDAYDRDGRLVCRLSARGVTDLTDASTCPITHARLGTPAVTFPAWNGEAVRTSVRLVEAFE